jgi:hypothetical protein
MANGIINLNSDSIGFEARIVWNSTPNISGKNTLTLDYQVRRTGTSANSSDYTIQTTVELAHGMANGSPTFSYTSSLITIGNNNGAWVSLTSSRHTIYNSQSDGIAIVSIGCNIEGIVNKVKYSISDTNITLDRIVKFAKITSAPNFKDTDNPVIEYSLPTPGVEGLEAAITDTTGTIFYAKYRDISKTSGIYTFYLTSEERAALIAATGNNTTLTVRFYVRTTANTLPTELSSLQKTMTLVAGGPTITATIEDTKHKYITGGGLKFIRGINEMQFSMTATGQKGATIESVAVICGNRTIRATSGTFTNIENETVIFSATDSRGKTSTKTITLEPIDYIKPTCNQKVRLIPKSETEAQITLEVNGNYFNQSFGDKHNFLQIFMRSRRIDEEYGEWDEITPWGELNGNTYSLVQDLTGFDPSGTYIFQCGVMDWLSEAYSEEYPVQFIPVFDWGKNDFNFNVPITIEGYPLNDYVVETGQEPMGTNGTWYWSKWRSGKAECYGCRNYGNMAVSTDWGGWFRSGSFNQNLPTGLFADTPEVIDINLRQGSSGGWVVRFENEEPTDYTTGSFIVVRPKSATISQAYISFNVIGRWK